MPDLITDDIRAWIGRSDPTQRIEVTRRDIIKYSMATEQCLDKYLRGDEAPPMFLFGAHQPLLPLRELGPDGLRKDSLLPDLPLKRIMAGGIKQTHQRALKPGDVVIITRTLTDIYEKRGSSGPLIFVVYEIEVNTEAGEPIMRETQSRIVR
ncbi:MAG: 3-methylfumaryl-CoA hydratase [Gammaproteobacteria bacterium]|jgi:3-methylfumaryl-CoA hydratase